jgi:tripeptide aminopeptidase
MYAMGQFLVEFAATKVPERTSYSVGVAGGGTSVNAIPEKAWIEIDMRSASPVEVDKLENRMKSIAAAATEAENKARSTRNGRIDAKFELLGDRPAGSVSYLPLASHQPAGLRATVTENTQLVGYAWEAMTAHGLKPELEALSTDANVPISLGIPAITISPGAGERNHSLDEVLNVSKEASIRQFGTVLTTLLATAGMRD